MHEDPGVHFSEVEWSSLLDGEPLSPGRLAHREACPVCAAEWRQRQALAGLWQAAPQPELPPGLATRIRAELARDAAARARGAAEFVPEWLLWWGRPVGMVAAALLLVLSVLLAPRLASRATAYPASLAWAAGVPADGDPLESVWDDESLMLGGGGARGADPGAGPAPVSPEGAHHPPTERAS